MSTSQERIVKLFEKNTYSVVNIFDVTLRPQLNITGVVEVFFLYIIPIFLYYLLMKVYVLPALQMCVVSS